LGGLAFDRFEFCDGVEGSIDNNYFPKFSSKVIPNPTKGKVSIEFEIQKNLEFDLEIFSSIGQSIKKINIILRTSVDTFFSFILANLSIKI